MSKVFIEESTLSSIGNAIRQKTGKSELISPGNMPTEIASITSGSSGTGGDDVVRQLLDGSFSGEYVNNDITTFRANAFSNTKVTKIDCPNVTLIPQSLAEFCRELVEVNLPMATYSHSSSFYGCEKLKILNLPNFEDAGDYFLYLSKSIEYLNLPLLIKCGSNGFGYLEKLTNLDVPALRDIGLYSFQKCSSLTEITLPELVCLSGQGAFQGCNKLKKVDLPIFGNTSYEYSNKDGQIQANTFNLCSSLDTLILRNNSEKATLMSKSAFANTPIASGTGYIYVPAELIDEYKTATNWVIFADQFRAIEDYPEIDEEVAE